MKERPYIALFPPHLAAVADALQQIFEGGGFADKVLEQVLKADPRRGARDRAFIAENTYEIVRWYRLLHTLRGAEPRNTQDWWEMIGIRYIIDGYQLPRWEEFRKLNEEAIERRFAKIKATRAVLESVPDWLDKLGNAQLGDVWPDTLRALNHPARVVLRANSLKTNAKELASMLAAQGIATEHLGDAALVVKERQNLFRTEAFKRGLFEVQDYSSQQVAPFAEVQPGMRVIDACAGGGGKTLHLASLMENKGQLIALDTEAWKLDELRKRAKRNGVHIVDTRPIDTQKVVKRLDQSADRLLLDVPCSGLGVLRRNPDAKWKLSAQFVEQVQQTQQDILQNYSRMVKPGGKLVYATCSILPAENERQIERFLEAPTGAAFALEEQQTLLPQDKGFDGFFMARLVRR